MWWQLFQNPMLFYVAAFLQQVWIKEKGYER